MEVCLALFVASLVITVVAYFTTRKKDSVVDVKVTTPVSKTRIDASKYVKVSVCPTGNYSGGSDSPSYMRQPIMIADIALIEEIEEELHITVDFSYTYISGFKDGVAIVQKGEAQRFATLSRKTNKVTLMCQPSLSINVISITKE